MSTQDGGGKGESGTERVGSRPSAELSFTCMLDEAERGRGEGRGGRALVGLLSLSNLLFIDYLFLHTNTGNSNLQQRSRSRDAIYVDEEERFWQCIRERGRGRARRSAVKPKGNLPPEEVCRGRQRHNPYPPAPGRTAAGSSSSTPDYLARNPNWPDCPLSSPKWVADRPDWLTPSR